MGLRCDPSLERRHPFTGLCIIGLVACIITVVGLSIQYNKIRNAYWTRCRAVDWWTKPAICQRSPWSEYEWPVTVNAMFEFPKPNGGGLMMTWGMQINCSDSMSTDWAKAAYPANFSFVCAWSSQSFQPLWLYPHGGEPVADATPIFVFAAIGFGLALISLMLGCFRWESAPRAARTAYEPVHEIN